MTHNPDFEPLDILGSTGLNRSGGFITEEWHPRLRGRQGVLQYREMADNDAIVGAFLYAIRSTILQVPWLSVAADDTNAARAERDFLDGARQDMAHTWDEMVSEILSMLPFGWAYFEQVYKLRQGDDPDATKRSGFSDGRIGWRKISLRSQDTLDRWEFDDDGGIRGMWQISPPAYKRVFVPIEKALLFRTSPHKNSPEGRSILRNAWRSWFFKKRIQEIEAIGIERDLAGLPVMEVPPELMHPSADAGRKALRSQLETLVQQIKRDEREGVIIPAEMNEEGKPTGYKLRLLSSGGRRPVDVNAIVIRYEQRMAMSVLAEFLMLGMDKVGSLALASTKTGFFALSLGAILGSIESVFNRFAIPRLMQLNGVPRALWPRIKHGDIEKVSAEETGALTTALANAGLLAPNEDLETAAREVVLRTLRGKVRE